jgi:hypothetical protein
LRWRHSRLNSRRRESSGPGTGSTPGSSCLLLCAGWNIVTLERLPADGSAWQQAGLAADLAERRSPREEASAAELLREVAQACRAYGHRSLCQIPHPENAARPDK